LEKEIDKERKAILEIIDDLIFHVNTRKSLFKFLLIANLILAPVILFVTLSISLYPNIFWHISEIAPVVGLLLTLLLVLTFEFSIFWIIFGVKEYKYMNNWDKRFQNYFSLKAELDKKLRE
jgi:hypothetical protein